MKILKTPITNNDIEALNVGDTILISGNIYCGRDAVLPKIQAAIKSDSLKSLGINLEGAVIFHTAVSVAGVGPTSSNKLEIESSMAPLSQAGVKLHLGKGKISQKTINEMQKYGAVYAVIPPVTALLSERTEKIQVVAFEELGMEAFFCMTVNEFPAVIAAAKGKSIYDEEK